jgi:hypothetical protein
MHHTLRLPLALFSLVYCLAISESATAEELALQVHLPRDKGAPVQLYLAVDQDTGSCLRSFAFNRSAIGKNTTWLQPWAVTVETTAADGTISGTVSAEQRIQVKGKSKPHVNQQQWQIALHPANGSGTIIPINEAEKETHTVAVTTLATPTITDDMMIALWAEWGVPHLDNKKDVDGMVAWDHVRNRAQIYGVPVIIAPLSGKLDGYDGIYPGSLNMGRIPAASPSPMGPMPYAVSNSYWRGRVQQSALAIADGQMSGHWEVDIRRSKKVSGVVDP